MKRFKATEFMHYEDIFILALAYCKFMSLVLNNQDQDSFIDIANDIENYTITMTKDQMKVLEEFAFAIFKSYD